MGLLLTFHDRLPHRKILRSGYAERFQRATFSAVASEAFAAISFELR
jgi:hypothetical protein